ncbi:MAG: hypothetical protein ABSB84_13015 [Verrucomicrobiota bacterium]|jgi:hypothetical protein
MALTDRTVSGKFRSDKQHEQEIVQEKDAAAKGDSASSWYEDENAKTSKGR